MIWKEEEESKDLVSHENYRADLLPESESVRIFSKDRKSLRIKVHPIEVDTKTELIDIRIVVERHYNSLRLFRPASWP